MYEDPHKMLREFDPLPSSKKLKKKVEYFFLPYNNRYLPGKHMKFDDLREEEIAGKNEVADLIKGMLNNHKGHTNGKAKKR